VELTRVFAGQDVRIDGRDVDVTALAYDSRRVGPGSLFAAIPGAKSDGHAFIEQAVKQGAVAILCERDVDTKGATKIIAKDARKALSLAAKRFFGAPSEQLTMVGVTGTNGKTTTTYLIASILEAAGLTTGVIGTLGVKLGTTTIETGLTTPESLELQSALATMLKKGAKAVAMEASSHALAQGRVEGVAYDVGVFTNLTHDHLDFHGTLDNYFEAKARLFTEHLKSNGKSVINIDDPRGAELAERLRRAGKTVVTVSASGQAADVSARAIDLRLQGLRFDAHTSEGILRIESPLVGRFNVENLSLAVGTALALGVGTGTIMKALRTRGVVPGRLERVQGNGPVVLVDYAHTPDALEKALSTLREFTTKPIVCVFGAGGDRDPVKRAPMGAAVAKLADVPVVTSDNPRSEDPRAITDAIEKGMGDKPRTVELDRRKAIDFAIHEAVRKNGVVLIAGKGHETYQQIGSEKHPFDDREVAGKVLAALTTEGSR
jgi:UDP-N-acetylmuramoyl-L-alanyl-D-glutamate--2,6-diaminopimelate ligase